MEDSKQKISELERTLQKFDQPAAGMTNLFSKRLI
jgi:hypothetical protein